MRQANTNRKGRTMNDRERAIEIATHLVDAGRPAKVIWEALQMVSISRHGQMDGRVVTNTIQHLKKRQEVHEAGQSVDVPDEEER